MDNNEQNNGQIQIDLPQEIAQGAYANLSIITHSNSDFVLDFARMLPGLNKATVGARVILAPDQAKRLLLALQENIAKYERNFGQIRLQQYEKGTIAPFNINKGEA